MSARIARSLRQPVTASGTARRRPLDRRDGAPPAAPSRLRAAPGIPRPPVSRPLPPPRSALHQLVTGAGIEVEMINRFQLLDALQILGAERAFAVECMQHDAFDQVPESNIVILRQGLHDLQNAFLDPHAGLHSCDDVRRAAGILAHMYQDYSRR